MVTVYVLTKLSLDSKGDVISRNVGVRFSLHEAELHKGKGIEHDFEVFQIDANWQDAAATTELVVAMRCFREYVAELQADALR